MAASHSSGWDTVDARADQHLRLTVETDGQNLSVLHTRVIREPAIASPRSLGPIVYQVVIGDRSLWIDTLADPLVQRGAPRPGTREHSVQTLKQATFTVRVPLPSRELPENLQVKVYRATAPLPERHASLEDHLRTATPAALRLVGTIDLATLLRHSDWQQVVAEGGLSVKVRHSR